MAARSGCIWNLGPEWNRVEGNGVQGRGWSSDLREKARELRVGLGVCGCPERMTGIGDFDSPAAWLSLSTSPPGPSGPRYSSDLKHMRMTRSVDSVQFLPFLTTDVK